MHSSYELLGPDHAPPLTRWHATAGRTLGRSGGGHSAASRPTNGRSGDLIAWAHPARGRSLHAMKGHPCANVAGRGAASHSRSIVTLNSWPRSSSMVSPPWPNWAALRGSQEGTTPFVLLPKSTAMGPHFGEVTLLGIRKFLSGLPNWVVISTSRAQRSASCGYSSRPRQPPANQQMSRHAEIA